ncbi:Thioesterase/thiol ester dehydrase-isomerase [Ascodesmis nigricans]|uniref:Thioesterase/thiol ester dehydrase-isomerase n=1 Tax=Ascodesmis nigricans TaxID=341454 RepID=A0A4S2MT03_9PEZI|nr:Thioesterase/thiol ester dehydrase-isomerase [Ascodesmis nigricans]
MPYLRFSPKAGHLIEPLLTIFCQGFDHDLMSNHLQVVSATAAPKGTVTFSLTVPPTYGNRMGNLHGGAAALIFDVCTTSALAPIAKPGYWQYAGVTRQLSCSYLRPVPVGSTVTVYAEVVHAGRRVATIKGEIRDKNGNVAVTCEHLKVSIDPVGGAAPPKVGGKL